MKPRDEAKRELRERSQAIREGQLPEPKQQPGETDEAFVDRVTKERRAEMQPANQGVTQQ